MEIFKYAYLLYILDYFVKIILKLNKNITKNCIKICNLLLLYFPIS